MGEKAATEKAYYSLHYPIKFSLGNANDNDRYNYIPLKSCTTAGFKKHSYSTDELMCTYDIDHAPRNSNRKQA